MPVSGHAPLPEVTELRLTRDGGWLHDGDPVRHEGLARLLHRSIARAADGSLVVTTGRDAAPISCEDAPFSVRTIDWHSGELVLSDESREPIARREFVVDHQQRVRCAVKGGAFWALLSRSATQGLLGTLGDDGRLHPPGGACGLTVLTPDPRDWSAPPSFGN
jgi:hypothetical protein